MPPTVLEKLTIAVENRKRYWQRIQYTYNLISKLNDTKVLQTFKVRCASLEDSYQKYESVLETINELNELLEDDSNKITDVLSSSSSLDEMYYAIKEAEAFVCPPPPSTPSTAASSVPPVVPGFWTSPLAKHLKMLVPPMMPFHPTMMFSNSSKDVLLFLNLYPSFPSLSTPSHQVSTPSHL